MNVTLTTGSQPVSLAQPDFDAVINLIDEMIAVVESENRELGRGIPASLSGSIARKNELADRFERWVALVKERRLQIPEGASELRKRLLERTARLEGVMAENISRLQAAMEASRHRVEAVMNAIRQQAEAESRYGANGRRAVPRVLSSGLGRQI
jgi:hypothetical protein